MAAISPVPYKIDDGPDREAPVFYAARLKRLKTLELLTRALRIAAVAMLWTSHERVVCPKIHRVKRTCLFALHMSASDPKGTSDRLCYRHRGRYVNLRSSSLLCAADFLTVVGCDGAV
jgi:hypothetical protein